MIKFKEWMKIKEAEAIVNNCKPHADYQVFGACSDLKNKKMGAFGFDIKKMSGFGNPGGIAVPKEKG